MSTIKTCGYGMTCKEGKVVPLFFHQRAVGSDDVHIEIDYAGICHSDVLIAKSGWGDADYPVIPGHEIVGTVKSVGPSVKKFKQGDVVAVGCFVDSCRDCANCKKLDENYCVGKHGAILTYNGRMKYSTEVTKTYGGYARDIVVKDRFVFKVPEKLKGRPETAPLLCAGITTYAPMKEYNADKPGTKIGVIGLGGLGHMAVKFGAAFGNEVTVMSRGTKKEALAKQLGAKRFVDTTNAAAVEKAANSLDVVINTSPCGMDLMPYLGMMAPGGVLVYVGAADLKEPTQIHSAPMCFKKLRIVGSLVGGTKGTEEMLEYCASKNIVPMCETMEMKDINTAWERMDKSDVRFRFVMDVKKSCMTVAEAEKVAEAVKGP